MKSWAVNNICKPQESKKEIFEGLNGVNRQPSNNLKFNRQPSKTLRENTYSQRLKKAVIVSRQMVSRSFKITISAAYPGLLALKESF